MGYGNIYSGTEGIYKSVGCISLQNYELSFEQPFKVYMTPVGYGFTMLEAAITNCLYYGVDSIWITVNDDELPWAKKCVGQLGYDPVRYIDRFSINKTDQRKRVPIYFVPTFTRYRDYCDNYTFGFINAGLMAKKVYGHVSSYCEPDYYFFSSPFGLLDPKQLREKRSEFKSANKKSLFYHNGQTALDGVHLPMCIDKEQLERLKKHTLSLSTGKSRTTGEYRDNGLPVFEKLPPEETLKGKRLTANETYSCLEEDEFSHYDLETFFNIESWDDYVDYMSSDLKVNKRSLLKRKYVLHPMTKETWKNGQDKTE